MLAINANNTFSFRAPIEWYAGGNATGKWLAIDNAGFSGLYLFVAESNAFDLQIYWTIRLTTNNHLIARTGDITPEPGWQESNLVTLFERV